MAGPEFPVNLGDTALQTDTERDITPRYQTHRGKASGRDLPIQPTMPIAEGYGRYNDDV